MKVAVVIITLGMAALFGMGLINNAEVILPLSLGVFVLTFVTVVAARSVATGPEAKVVEAIVIWAILLRFSALLAIHFGLSPYFFAPDAIFYEDVGRQLAMSWTGTILPPRQAAGLLPTYFDFNAILYLALGHQGLAAAVINMFFGVWTVLLTYLTARDLLGLRYAKWAALITASFPSLVLWSVLNIRDAMATFVVTLIVFLGVRLLRKVSLPQLVLLIASCVALQALRDYMAFLVAAGLMLGVVAATGRQRLLPTVVLGVTATVFVAVLADQLGLFQGSETVDTTLQSIGRMRTGLQANAGSSYGGGADTGTIGEALRFLPLGIAFLLFAPFPWRIESTLQMAAMPETLLWYPLFVFSLAGVRRVAAGRTREWLVPACILLVVVSSYALVEGNFGTAYRHRAQIMPIFFIFASVGVDAAVTWVTRLVSRGKRQRTTFAGSQRR